MRRGFVIEQGQMRHPFSPPPLSALSPLPSLLFLPSPFCPVPSLPSLLFSSFPSPHLTSPHLNSKSDRTKTREESALARLRLSLLQYLLRLLTMSTRSLPSSQRNRRNDMASATGLCPDASGSALILVSARLGQVERVGILAVRLVFGGSKSPFSQSRWCVIVN